MPAPKARPMTLGPLPESPYAAAWEIPQPPAATVLQDEAMWPSWNEVVAGEGHQSETGGSEAVTGGRHQSGAGTVSDANSRKILWSAEEKAYFRRRGVHNAIGPGNVYNYIDSNPTVGDTMDASTETPYTSIDDYVSTIRICGQRHSQFRWPSVSLGFQHLLAVSLHYMPPGCITVIENATLAPPHVLVR